MDLPGEKVTKISGAGPRRQAGDARRVPQRRASGSSGLDLSPSAKRAVFEARGELFTVPAEKGDVRNLTNTPGVRERDPAWSPDGKWIAYLSDKTRRVRDPRDRQRRQDARPPGHQGLRHVPLRPALVAGLEEARVLRQDAARLWWCDVATGKLTQDRQERVRRDPRLRAGPPTRSGWPTPSRAPTGFEPDPCSTRSTRQAVTPVTDGMTDDFSPRFDPEGQVPLLHLAAHVRARSSARSSSTSSSAPRTGSTRRRCRTPCARPCRRRATRRRAPAQGRRRDGAKDAKDAKGGKDAQGRARTRPRRPTSHAGARSTSTGIGQRASRRCRCRRPLRGLSARSKGKLVFVDAGATPIRKRRAPADRHDPRLRPRQARGQDRSSAGVDAGYAVVQGRRQAALPSRRHLRHRGRPPRARRSATARSRPAR